MLFPTCLAYYRRALEALAANGSGRWPHAWRGVEWLVRHQDRRKLVTGEVMRREGGLKGVMDI